MYNEFVIEFFMKKVFILCAVLVFSTYLYLSFLLPQRFQLRPLCHL